MRNIINRMRGENLKFYAVYIYRNDVRVKAYRAVSDSVLNTLAIAEVTYPNASFITITHW